MHATTVAVDLAKSVFQLAVADTGWKVIESICYAVLRDATPYGLPQPRQARKLNRTAFAVAA